MDELTINLKNNEVPYYEQIYDYIKSQIQAGKIKYKEKLPSTRKLAAYLCLSRSTINMAYEQLLSEGYIESRPNKGYFVCNVEDLFRLDIQNKSFYELKEEIGAKYKYDFSLSRIDLENFPYDKWRKISKNLLSDDRKELFQTGSSMGEFSLRETICNYLYRARGVNCNPDQIIIGAGNEYLLILLGQIIGKGKCIAMENPTYTQAYNTFNSMGYKVKPVPMDKNGIRIDKLKESLAQLVYVMPSHQFPLGIVMPITRRMELLNWANDGENRYIIEDDYDSEFRYKGKPIPALQGFDTDSKVIYMGTFSKSIAPAIRISYMVLPDKLLEKYKKAFSFYYSTVSRIDQQILNTFINEGHYERHLNKMRSIYKNKHDILIDEFKSFDSKVEVSGENAGLHILINVDRLNIIVKKIIDKLMKKGVKVYNVNDYLISPVEEEKNTFLIGYAANSENDIIEGIRIIKNTLFG